MNAESEVFADQIPEYGKDVKINFATVLTPEGSPGLSEAQIVGSALGAAYASNEKNTVRYLESIVREKSGEAYVQGVKSAASIMAMNNVYYRFLHLVGDKSYQSMPARLRMTVIGNPGIDKIDFEVYSLAVSIVNACGYCVEAHAKKVETSLSKEAVQSVARIASVVRAVAQIYQIETL